MAQSQETILDVAGMSCSSCAARVAEALRAVDGVSAAEVTEREGKARVRHDPSRAPARALVAAVEQAGYAASPAR
jgi:copper chaperone CopZ